MELNEHLLAAPARREEAQRHVGNLILGKQPRTLGRETREMIGDVVDPFARVSAEP